VTLVDHSLEQNYEKVLENVDYYRDERQCLDSSSGRPEPDLRPSIDSWRHHCDPSMTTIYKERTDRD
jgi:hypothetical protein